MDNWQNTSGIPASHIKCGVMSGVGHVGSRWYNPGIQLRLLYKAGGTTLVYN